MQIKDIIVVEGRLKLDAKALDVKAKEEVTDKIYTFPGGPKLTRYLNIPFQATVQRAKTEYYKSNQVSVGQAVDNAIEHYMKNPEEADAENNKERKGGGAKWQQQHPLQFFNKNCAVLLFTQIHFP